MKIGVVFISRSIFNPYGLIDTFIRMTNPKKRKYALSLDCSILIDMKTTLLTIMIIGVAFVLMNLSLLIKSKPLEKRCSDEGCECDCRE